MIRRLIDSLIKSNTQGTSQIANTVGGFFAVNKEAHSDYRQTALSQYQAEFHARARRTWFDALADGMNRLIRPTITLTLMSAIPAAFIWPQSVDVAFAALASLPDTYWMVLSLVLGFYFGGRMQLKSQDFRRQESARSAVAAAVAETVNEDNQQTRRPRNRPPRNNNFTKPNRQVSKVFLHCTAFDHLHHDNIETLRD